MDTSVSKPYFGAVIVLGTLWGLSEAALGMGLRSCAAAVSGSVMTGVALFFLAAGWAASRRVAGVAVMVLVAAIFKMSDALLLSLPLRHGAIGNPVFAFVMEAAAFVVFVSVLREGMIRRPAGQALLGGMSALLAANLFPLVKFATGVAACVAPGTGYPLSLYYVHFAVLSSMGAVPLGFWAGSRVASLEGRLAAAREGRLGRVLAPAVLALGLAILAVLRLA